VNISKTAAIEVLALQSVASNSVVASAAQDVSTKLAALVCIHFGRRAAAALTEGVEFRIEGSSKASGDGHWFPLASIKTAIAACESEAVTGNNAAGQAVLTCASTTNLLVGNIVFIDNTTIGNSEWGRIKTVTTNTSITLEDNLLNAQNNPAPTIYNGAEMYALPLDLTAVTRLRVVVNASNTGQAVAVEVFMVTGDSIS